MTTMSSSAPWQLWLKLLTMNEDTATQPRLTQHCNYMNGL